MGCQLYETTEPHFLEIVSVAKSDLTMKYCSNCGHRNDDNAKFCGDCGSPFHTSSQNSTSENFESGDSKSENVNPSSSILDGLNGYVGNKNPVNLNWKMLFVDVLKKHSKSEAENIFICGTETTTPSIDEVSQQWPHPWLYSRVLLMFLIAFFLLYICCSVFENSNAIPGLIVVGSFTVPLSGLVLFLEVNAYRNISMYDVAMIFLVGGCASLVATLFLFSIIGVGELDYLGALLVGIIEEIGKAVIVYYFIKKLNKRRILPGLLIGASVGAGFAAFESAGYAMNCLLGGGWDLMMNVIFLRGFLTPGGHIAWAAITGVAMIIASKESGALNSSVFTDKKFLRLFAIPVILHALWDCPLSSIGSDIYFWPIVLTILVWVVVLIFINMGLDEIENHKKQNNDEIL